MLRKVTFKGNPMTLVGRNLKLGMLAPDFKAVSTDLKEVGLIDVKDKIKVITSFLSLDTPVCDLQVKEFNKRAVGLSSDIVVVGISKDLPFAQKRFCQANEIKNVTVLSDYKYSSFGINYGLLVKEMNLLARSVVILDKNNILRYMNIVEEMTNPPDYEDALNNLKEIINNPAATVKEELPSKCKPCEGGVSPLPQDKVEKLLAQYRGWELDEEKIAKKIQI
jgi:thiol peroxidase